jgi:hypothetical protein
MEEEGSGWVCNFVSPEEKKGKIAGGGREGE